MLADWNFQDDAVNSTFQQINRQKSARNLEILAFDPSEPRAVFFDPKRSNKHTATLHECACNDFNLAGSSPRKSLKPCMHIYRLAIELGLMEAKYLDRDARFAMASVLSREETLRLQRLPRDPDQWGHWADQIHSSGPQRNRQYRAYFITEVEHDAKENTDGSWSIHEYHVSLSDCACMDFLDRRLPCKHIYALARMVKIPLPLTLREFEVARSQGAEIIFDFYRDDPTLTASNQPKHEQK